MSLPRRKVRDFLSYAHADSADVTRPTGLLDPLLTAAADFHFERWSDHQIRLGKPWRGEIDQALEQCDFGLMLVSPRFVASTFIGEKEVPPLLRKSIVIPVALHEIPFDGSLRLWGMEQLQFFLHENQPFDYFERERDQRAFANQLFRRLLQELRTAASPAATPPQAAQPPVAPARKPEPPKPPAELDALLAELAQPATKHQRRQTIGHRLAELGDPRPGTGVLNGVPDILWRSIPGRVDRQMLVFSITRSGCIRSNPPNRCRQTRSPGRARKPEPTAPTRARLYSEADGSFGRKSARAHCRPRHRPRRSGPYCALAGALWRQVHHPALYARRNRLCGTQSQ